MDKVKNLGQVYTPIDIVEKMVSMVKNSGTILEPSSGEGVFSDYISNNNTNLKLTSIEIDPNNYKPGFITMDFFDYSIDNKFDTIIGNPPYVAFKNITVDTLQKIHQTDYLIDYDNRTNLFIHFIRKSVEHLNEGGEIIFITPREFIKSTSSIKLNNFLYQHGTITDWYEYGDQVLFKNYSPTVVIWRYEKDNFTRETMTNNGLRKFMLNDGQISFTNKNYDVKFSDLFMVKVGAVSGKDDIFTHDEGNKEFVCSYTKKTGELKRMFFNVKNDYLESHKEVLINRKIKNFNEGNWWQWGRGLYESDSDRIYVNCKTRDMKPFFTNDCKYYDGSVLAIFPKVDMDISKAVEMLNNVDWDDLGFKVGGRLVFSQKALENTFLPEEFGKINNIHYQLPIQENQKTYNIDELDFKKVKEFVEKHSDNQSKERKIKNKLLAIQYKLEDYIEKDDIEENEVLDILDFIKLYLKVFDITKKDLANIQQYYSENRLTISEYYQIIKEKLESNDYTTSTPRDINPHLEAINYLQWEFMSDRKDPRIDKVFSDIFIPNGVNQGNIDIDFSKYSVEEFLKEIMTLKD